MKKMIIIVAVLSLIAVAAPAVAQEEGLELAVYNQNLALVKDLRSLDLSEGLNEVRFVDVAALIDPTSVSFRSLTDPEGTSVLEQNYEYDIVGSAKLLQKYVDMEIAVVLPNADKRRPRSGEASKKRQSYYRKR